MKTNQPNVGDTLYCVTSGLGGPMITLRSKVAKITPTGIIVLDNGTRLRPADRNGYFKIKGANVWSQSDYVAADHEDLTIARANTAKRNAKNAANDAHDKWRRDPHDADLCDALTAAVQQCRALGDNA